MKIKELQKLKDRFPDKWLDLWEFHTRFYSKADCKTGKGCKQYFVPEAEVGRFVDNYETN